MRLGPTPKHKPVSALTLLSNEELRGLNLQMNACLGCIADVNSKEWFDLAYECSEIEREMERRRELRQGLAAVPLRGRVEVERDYSTLKRQDLTKMPTRRLAFDCASVASNLMQSIERHGNEIQLARWSFDDQREVWEKASHHLAGVSPALEAPQVSALRSLVLSLKSALEADERRLPKHASFRVVLNKRISLLIEISKRLEAA